MLQVQILDYENNTYLHDLLRVYLKKGDKIEIHCWNEDIDIIDFIQSKGFTIARTYTYITIFGGIYNDDFTIEELFKGEYGLLTFFTLDIDKKIRIEHNGKEIELYSREKEKIKEFLTILDNNKLDYTYIEV